MRFFLWIAILGWAVGFAAKLFDLVVAGAWTASPPASFTLLPYGSRYPVNPGDFFIPLSALIALGSLGALVSGWKSPARPWLWLGVTVFLLIWVLTPTRCSGRCSSSSLTQHEAVCPPPRPSRFA